MLGEELSDGMGNTIGLVDSKATLETIGGWAGRTMGESTIIQQFWPRAIRLLGTSRH